MTPLGRVLACNAISSFLKKKVTTITSLRCVTGEPSWLHTGKISTLSSTLQPNFLSSIHSLTLCPHLPLTVQLPSLWFPPHSLQGEAPCWEDIMCPNPIGNHIPLCMLLSAPMDVTDHTLLLKTWLSLVPDPLLVLVPSCLLVSHSQTSWLNHFLWQDLWLLEFCGPQF